MSEADIRHDLFVYETDAAAVAQIERFAVAGLEADESVMVVVSAAKQRLLREAFGAAAEFVMFVDTREVYTRPEDTMAAFDGVVRKSVEVLDAGLRVYGEVPVCRTQAEWNGWIAYESAVNRAFASRPVVLMCGYDARVVPEAVIRQAWQAHRVVHSGGVWQISRDYLEPETLVRSLAPRVRGDPGPALAADRRRAAARSPRRGGGGRRGARGARPRPAGRGGRGVLQRRAVRPRGARTARGTRRLALRLRGEGRGERVRGCARRLPTAAAARARRRRALDRPPAD